jgi:negative regulator of sigma E activity
LVAGDGWLLEQFQAAPLPTTNHRQASVNRQGIRGSSPRIVIHAASDEEAAACWEQAVATTVLDGLINHRRSARHAGASPRYEVAFTA